jgi:hypothetical protein
MSEWLDKLIRSEGVEITGKDGDGWSVREDGVEISQLAALGHLRDRREKRSSAPDGLCTIGNRPRIGLAAVPLSGTKQAVLGVN